MKILISGGGTGGHVYPAIAIAEALHEIDESIEIHFVGAEGKIEMEAVPKAGFSIEGLWISGFQRKLTLRNLIFPFKLVSSLFKAGGIIRRFRPDVIVGVGGYASGPILKMGARRNLPILIQEQNSFPGITNRILSKDAKKVCVAFEGMERFFSKDKIILTGNPLRKKITPHLKNRGEALRHFGFDPILKTIVVVGGSLGAYTLNESMKLNAKMIRESGVQFLWQIGKYYWDDYKECETAKLPNVKSIMFIDRMDLAYSVSDLLICRAGALTISELCLMEQAAVLVPSPNVAEDHQTKNAMALVNEGAAEMIEDVELKNRFGECIELVFNDAKIEELQMNAGKLGKPNAAIDVANQVLALVE